MTKFVANIGLLAASTALMFAQYWYTFGLWPKSWTSFCWCTGGMLVVIVLRVAMEKES